MPELLADYQHLPGNLNDLDTPETLALNKVLSDDKIIADLEKQFEPAMISTVATVADARRYANIDASMPQSTQVSQTASQQLHRNLTALQIHGLDEVADRTMAGDEAAVAAEPEIPHSNELRDFTPEESKIALAALRKAAANPRYRLEANDILAHRAPSKLERLRRRVALQLGKTAQDLK